MKKGFLVAGKTQDKKEQPKPRKDSNSAAAKIDSKSQSFEVDYETGKTKGNSDSFRVDRIEESDFKMTKVENKNGLNLKIENGKFIFTPCS